VFVCVLREMCVWLLLFGFLFVGMGMGSFLTSFCECVVFLCLEVEFFFYFPSGKLELVMPSPLLEERKPGQEKRFPFCWDGGGDVAGVF